MKKNAVIVFVTVLILNFSVANAHETLLDRESLKNSGIDFDVSVTQIYQNNVRGGLSTHNHRGRYSGRYDFELYFDGQKIFGLENSLFYMHNRGSWTDAGGIDGTSVGSIFGVNANAFGDRAFDIVELWYQQGFNDNKFILRLGKLDLTGGFECKGCPVSFDGSSFANNETAQFMNGALVNNPTIPFPDNGLGIIGHYNPVEWWYISAGIADAQADFRETGFNTAFHDEDYFFSIAETGIVTEIDSANGPLQGAYRAGLWYDPQPKGHSDMDKRYRDDTGFYLSFDQMLHRENADDQQGLGTFFRYGYAPSKANDLTNFVSAGLQYQGLLEGRDDDVLGFGFAKGFLSDKAKATYTEDAESVYEIYYNAQILPTVNVTPSLQYIVHPGAINSVGNATVLAVRVSLAF
ncbi:MAG: carbohydrate porin [Planctomycetes bacterium]|nr:carbohydrate porin [Planctomycetota bacterium]MBU1518778.1 carbohydrate porin [Planctomycetota bacterium]MBU2597515.1 carbohydrate porin [Planctomycetota bacterium]